MRALEPSSVIESLNQYENHGDLPNAMNLFADDAVLRIQPAPAPFRNEYHGRQEIEQFERELMKGKPHVESSSFDVTGNQVTWQMRFSGDSFQQMGVEQAEATGHAVLWGALIKSMDINFDPETAQKMRTKSGPQQK